MFYDALVSFAGRWDIKDKSIIYLPRQCLRNVAKAMILLGFLDGNAEFTPLEDRIGIIKKVVIIQLVKK
ncbi:hypothetical protein DW974_05890 [Lachnospiraceae bacterium AM48-27BH]|nr:hypothetical protein DW974_05890 [Lachnospiraceae bacterium AM48-27BH]